MTVVDALTHFFSHRNAAIVRLGAVYIYPSAIFLPALIYFLSAGYFVLLTAIAVAIHELGHYTALKLFGGEIKQLKLWIGGVSMVYGGLGYTAEAVAALSGPAASLLLAIVSSLFGRVFFNDTASVPAYQLSGLSLLLAGFNMLPVFPLDGGRVLYSVSAIIFGLGAAERVRKCCAIVVTGAIGVAGGAVLWVYGNPTLFAAAVALALGAAGVEE